MRFRLRTILWAFAVYASAASVFGPIRAALLAPVVVGFWAVRLEGVSNKASDVIKVFVPVSLVLFILVPAVFSAREAAGESVCFSRLKGIVIAVLDYKNRTGALPPSHTVDEQGKPLASWRALILPSIGEQALANVIRYNEPWESPYNKPFTDTVIGNYRCWSDANDMIPHSTSYFAISDDRTLWSRAAGKMLSSVTDPLESTILVIEASGKNAPWAKPEDLTFDEAVDLLCGDSPYYMGSGHWHDHGFFYRPSKVLHVGFANGNCRSISRPLDRRLASALLTCNGGEEIDLGELDRVLAPELDYAKVYATVAFAFLSSLPAVRWRR